MARLIFDCSKTVTGWSSHGLEPIEGSPIVKEWDDGTAETADGKLWYWDNQDFKVAENTPIVPTGEWKEYKV